MKFAITIFVLLISINLLSQGKYFITTDSTKFDLKSMEIRPNKQTILDFIRFVRTQPKLFDQFKQKPNEFKLRINALNGNIHFVDLNKDGRTEVIYQGITKSDGGRISIFQNIGNTYKLVFEDKQNIINLLRDSTNKTQMYICDSGTKADYEVKNKVYELGKDKNNIITFHKIYQSVSSFFGKAPEIIFNETKRFEVTINDYKMRFEPCFNDKSLFVRNDPTKGINGNVIGSLMKGAKGTAIGKKKDKTGKEWWYVELDEGIMPKGGSLYLNDQFPTKVVGWINNKYVKLIKSNNSYLNSVSCLEKSVTTKGIHNK